MHRFPLLTAVAVAAVLGVTACGDSDEQSSAPPTATASQAASKQPASGEKLAPDDAKVLSNASKTVDDYCNGHKATSGEVTGAVATVESLLEIDPQATDASGQTVKQVTTAMSRKLRECGAKSAAKRLTSAAG